MSANVRTKEVELPVIPREVADVFAELEDAASVVDVWLGRDGPLGAILQTLSFHTLITALSVGYVIERTPEEIAAEQRKIAEYRIAYAIAGIRRDSSIDTRAYISGVDAALRYLSASGYVNIPQINVLGEIITESTEVSE